MIVVSSVKTEKAQRYMKALCNHFAQKTKASYEENKGTIEFLGGRCELTATENTLTLQVEADNADRLSLLKDVVADHLLRFAPGEITQINWGDVS